MRRLIKMAKSPGERLEEFFSAYKRLNYKKGHLIIHGDDIPQGIYYLHKGYVRIYSVSETGQELTLIIFKPGDFFPMIWAIIDTKLTQMCESMTPVEVSRAPKEDFVNFIKSTPEVLFEITSKILIRFRGVLERMEYMVFGNAYQKTASILVICGERFGEKLDGKILIPIPLTHKDIANLIGMTRETVTIELNKLEKEKIIERNGHRYCFLINDMDKLREEALWYEYM